MKKALSILFTALAVSLSVHAAAAPKLVKKVPPEFPSEATRKSISSGTVTAKVMIDADGKVSAVEIIEANPKRVFDRAVQDALMDWRYEASGEKQSTEIKLVFKNED